MGWVLNTKMIWNYKIIKDKGSFYVAEVFYEKGKVIGYSEPICGHYESKEELLKDLKMMHEDCVKSKVINEKDLPRPDLIS